MKPEEIRDILRQVQKVWTRQEMDAESAKQYAEALIDLPANLTMEAVKRLRATDDWMPSISRIRRKVYGLAGFGPPHLDVAMDQAHEWLHYRNQKSFVNGSGYTPTAPQVHPLVLTTLRGIGASSDKDWETSFRFEYEKEVGSWKEQILAMSFNDVQEMMASE